MFRPKILLLLCVTLNEISLGTSLLYSKVLNNFYWKCLFCKSPYNPYFFSVVRQTCNRGTVFTPVPSTVNSICLQCICVMPNISYCKTLIVQLSVVCSAALVVNPVVVATTATTTTTRAPTVTVPTIPTSIVTATTAIGINPRASSPASAGMMSGMPTTLVMSGSPMMMMIMAASNAAAGVTVATATVAPAPAG